MKNINIKDTMIKMGKMTEEERVSFIENLCTSSGIFSYAQSNDFYDKGDFFSITNLIIPARVQKDKIVLTAHYDVIPGSKGYNDNLSGVITLLLLAGEVTDNVEIVFCDKEECGYLGASYYIFKNRHELKMNINVDIVGIPGMIYYTKYPTYKKSTKVVTYKPKAFKSTYGYATNYSESYLLDDYADLMRGEIDQDIELPSTEEAIEIFNLPFNDAKAFDKKNIPAIIIMSAPEFPDSKNIDADFLKEVFQYQHNNKNDNKIDLISPENIQKIANYIQDIIAVNN